MQVVRDQRAPRRARLGSLRIPHIGHHRHASIGGDTGPGAAGAQVAPADHAGCVVPAGQRSRWAGVELVAIASHDQPPARVVEPSQSK